MILRAITLLVVAVGLILYTVAFARKRKTIQNQWLSAYRHIVALIAGWVAFGILSGLFVLIDLFERDKFSLTAFANGLLMPLIIFIAGMILLRITIITSDR
jgi:hypothetical protein